MAVLDRRLVGVSIGARTTAEAEVALREVARVADIAELRLDLMAEHDLARLLRDRPCPVVVTNRPRRAGGRFRGSEVERVGALLQAIDLGADYVDVEHDSIHLIHDRKTTRLVASYHDFQGTPANLVEIAGQLAAQAPDIVKVVGTAQRLADNLVAFDALAQAQLPTIAIEMGDAGLLSRVLALRYDACFLTYATLGQGEPVAPAQSPVAVLRDVYQARQIGSQTAIYGVLSVESVPEPLLASLNAATRGAGIDGVWVPFVPAAGESEGVAGVVKTFRGLGVAGYLIAESARSAALPAADDVALQGPGGEINVLYARDGRLVGVWEPTLSEAFALVTGTPAESL